MGLVFNPFRKLLVHAQSVDDVQPEVDEAGEATTLFLARFIGFVADCVRATLEDTPEHAARLAILLRAVSHFTTTLLSDIDLRSLVASYEPEARKKVLSAFYAARAILVEYDVLEGAPSSLPLPSLPRRFQATPQFLPVSVDKVSMRSSISMNFRRSSIPIVHLLNLSSLPSSRRYFSHLPPPPRAPLSMRMA